MAMLTVRLDEQTDMKLQQLMQDKGLSRSALIKQFINQEQEDSQDIQAETAPLQQVDNTQERQRYFTDLAQDRGLSFAQNNHLDVLIDAGSIISFYHNRDPQHTAILHYIDAFQGQLITSLCCIAEVMWAFKADPRVQLELLIDLNQGLFVCPSLVQEDYHVMQNHLIKQQYQQSFSDLSLMALSQQLSVHKILCHTADFTRYYKVNSLLDHVLHM